MIRIRLPQEESERLDRAYRQEADPRFRDRIQIVRLASRDRPHKDIARDLAVTPRTVQRWLNAYLAGGLDGLRPRKAPGAPGKIPAGVADEVKRWVIEGRAGPGPRQLDARGAGRPPAEGQGHPHQPVGRRPLLPQVGHPPVPPRLPPRARRPRQAGPGPRGGRRAEKKAEAGEVALLSQDEARFPMVPTLCATLGVKGHRPKVGTRDCKDLLYVFAVVNLAGGALHANTLGSPAGAKKKTGKSKTRRMQEAFAAHLRHVGRVYPAGRHGRVVLVIDNAPWHRGTPVAEALAENPHLEFYRLPSYSPQLNPVERLRKVLRRRATHNRLFDTLADLKRSVRAGLGYFQAARDRVKTLLLSRRKQKKANQTASAGV